MSATPADMSDESDPLTKLAESVADGEPIDWNELDALAADPSLRALVEHLRVVAGVGDVHRSQVDEDTAPPADALPSTPSTPSTPEIAGTPPPPGIPGSPSTPPPAVPPGDASQMWGHLALIRKVGEGAFGEVYLAHDTWLDHPRALKLLKPEVARRIGPNQLLHEARKLVRVAHPNVVTVHGADRHDGRIGFWMDFIDGPTLADRLTDGRLGAGEATYIGQELCQALSAVHLRNLIHRDIKAQNVMRSADDGRIILMDFGAGEFVDLPRQGNPQGTPLYLAPELFARQPATVQSDIYALGVLLYHLVTGSFPVEGRSVDELEEAHRAGRRQRLRAVRPDLPAGFIDVVERAMDPDPARRFPTAADMHAALGGQSSVGSHQSTVTSHQSPVSDPPSTLAEVGRSAGHSLARGIAYVAAALVAIEVIGYIASRTFDITLHVEPAFAGRPLDFLRLGLQGVFPFTLYWLAGAALLAVLSGIDVALGGKLTTGCRSWLSTIDASGAVRIAAAICAISVLAWLVIVTHYWALFSTLFELQLGSASTASDVHLTPTLRELHVAYSNLAGWLTFALVAALAWLFPAIEERCSDRSTLRSFKGAAVVLVGLIIASAVAPRRIVQDDFDRVIFEDRPSFVIGTTDDAVLVYQPDRPGAGAVRVRRDDPKLKFEQTKPQRLVDPL